MTHPHHPLYAQAFDLVTRGQNWREDRAWFYDRAGRLCSVPANWTDLAAVDPFNAVADGRATLRTQELLELADLFEALRS